MTAIQLIGAPIVKAAAKFGSTLTYEEVPPVIEKRKDYCPYLGRIPYFAPKLEKSGK
jgi:hypothetical protein